MSLKVTSNPLRKMDKVGLLGKQGTQTTADLVKYSIEIILLFGAVFLVRIWVGGTWGFFPVHIPSNYTVILFVVPILYGSLNLGIKGGIVTAIIATLLSLPGTIAAVKALQAAEVWGIVVQLAAMDVIAVFTGQEVDKRQAALEETEQARRAYMLAKTQAESYAMNLLKVEEDERRRIAQELHDEPIQVLTHLCRSISNLSEDDNLSQSFKDSLLDILNTAYRCIEDLRNITRGLRPPMLNDLGLTTSLNKLVAQLQERSNNTVNARFILEGDEFRLQPEVELALFRIAQEALVNIERHSSANNATVVISFFSTGHIPQVRLTVTDDGCGFKLPLTWETTSGESPNELSYLPSILPPLQHSKALGLLGMAERARSIGAYLKIDSIPQNGTCIVVTIDTKGESSCEPG